MLAGLPNLGWSYTAVKITIALAHPQAQDLHKGKGDSVYYLFGELIDSERSCMDLNQRFD